MSSMWRPQGKTAWRFGVEFHLPTYRPIQSNDTNEMTVFVNLRGGLQGVFRLAGDLRASLNAD